VAFSLKMRGVGKSDAGDLAQHALEAPDQDSLPRR
jgi:hypothetical protein